jgi:hypothetical protein
MAASMDEAEAESQLPSVEVVIELAGGCGEAQGEGGGGEGAQPSRV